MAIDIGADAIDRVYAAANASFKLCLIEGSNPATVAGTVRKVYIYMELSVACNPVYVGIFTHQGSNVFSSRDHENVGPLYDGINEKDVDLDVEIGDYIGLLMPILATGNGIDLDYDASWTNNYWRTLADSNFPYTNYTFDNLGKRIISLYGEIDSAPTITTDPATAITPHTATLNGTLLDDGGLVCEVRFEWGLTGAYGNTTAWHGGYTTGMTFQERIYNLPGGVLVYFRAVARNAIGTTYGAQERFNTIPREPIITTDPATQISTGSAVLNGTVIDDMGAACRTRFEYGGTSVLGVETPWDMSGFATGASFLRTIVGLSPGDSFFYRAIGENRYGRGYGAIRSFTTLNADGSRSGFPMELLLLTED